MRGRGKPCRAGILAEHKVKLDKDSKKESKFKLNGEEVNEMIYKGKDEDGPCSVSISLVPIKDKIVVLTYWVTTAKEGRASGRSRENSAKPEASVIKKAGLHCNQARASKTVVLVAAA